MTHGRLEEANAVLEGIEAKFRARGHGLPDEPLPVIRLRQRRSTPLAEVAHTLFRVERRRTLVGLSLMAAQAFFYNAIFFTYALVLTDFFPPITSAGTSCLSQSETSLDRRCSAGCSIPLGAGR